jgi:UDP-N-acetylglucosamine--N-acetylmuramyl-(pentapeptide) pyrophosphoryl-undecaprenol N-acetylglucosamine transferase
LEKFEVQATGNRKIIIAGGGTGGHIFPAIAIANAIKRMDEKAEILFVGAKGKMEMEKVPQAGYKIEGLDIAGFNRSSLIKNIGLPFKLARSFLQVRRIFKNFKPGAAIGVGGYSSFPVMRLAQMRGIPTFIHESNSLPGKSNIMLGKRATGIFVSAAGMEKYLPAKKIIVSGNPVRNVFLQKIPRNVAANFFGLKPEIKTVFIMGGSLGAKSINETIEKNVHVFKENNLQLIWQTGKLFSGNARIETNTGENIWRSEFINRMECAYAAADIVVARSGAMTIAELCVVGKAAILVPYPFASEDHQAANALALVREHAALMVRDADVAATLIDTILNLVKDEKKTGELQVNISKLSITNADEIIANEILEAIQKKY